MLDLYIAHYGIQGQRWGVRRYRNDDGTLTDAGKRRYAYTKEYKDSPIRRLLVTGSLKRSSKKPNEHYISLYSGASENYTKKADRAASYNDEKLQKKMLERAKKYRNRADAFEKLKIDRLAYDEHTSTGKMVAQNLTFGYPLVEVYRNKRAMGVDRGKAYIRTFRHRGLGHTLEIEDHYQLAEKHENG